MPKQPRYQAKQSLTAVSNELSRATDKLCATALMFQELHPEYYQAMMVIADQINTLKKAVDEVMAAV